MIILKLFNIDFAQLLKSSFVEKNIIILIIDVCASYYRHLSSQFTLYFAFSFLLFLTFSLFLNPLNRLFKLFVILVFKIIFSRLVLLIKLLLQLLTFSLAFLAVLVYKALVLVAEFEKIE